MGPTKQMEPITKLDRGPDINQTVVRGKFAMVIIADASRSTASAAELKERFRKQGEQLGVRIYAQREDLFNAMHRI